jgi:hypothetical protein
LANHAVGASNKHSHGLPYSGTAYWQGSRVPGILTGTP